MCSIPCRQTSVIICNDCLKTNIKENCFPKVCKKLAELGITFTFNANQEDSICDKVGENEQGIVLRFGI